MRVLVVIPALIPSVYVGIVKPLLQLSREHSEFSVRFQFAHLFSHENLDGVDKVVFCRNTTVIDLHVLNEVLRKGVPYVYELDDNFFAIDVSTEIGKFHRYPTHLFVLEKFIKNAQCVRVYSKGIRKRCLAYNKNVIQYNSYFDFTLLDNKVEREGRDRRLRIVYATSRVEDQQQSIIINSLRKLAHKYRDRVEIYFWGARVDDEELMRLANVKHLQPVYNYEKFIRKFTSMSFDIGLAPVFDDEFYNSKTNNKYREYGACGVAGIYSDTTLYNDCVVHGENGLLVQNDEQSWYTGLVSLIENTELLNKVKQAAHVDVLGSYTMKNQVVLWRNMLSSSTVNENAVEVIKVAALLDYDNDFSGDEKLLEVLTMFVSVLDHSKNMKVLTQKGFRNYFLVQDELDMSAFDPQCRYVVFLTEDSEHELPENVVVITSGCCRASGFEKLIAPEEYHEDIRFNPYVWMLEFLNDEFLLDSSIEFKIGLRERIRLLRNKFRVKRDWRQYSQIFRRRLSDMYVLIKLNHFQ